MDSSGFYLIDPDFNVLHMNETAKTIYPNLTVGKKCYACLMGLDSPCGPCPVVAGIKGPRTYVDPIRKITESVDAVDVPLEGYGLCHALVFSTVGSNAAFAATLPTTSEDLRQLALIQSLTIDYSDVFSVNLTDRRATIYRHNGQATGAYAQNNRPLYSELSANYIHQYIVQEDREIASEQLDLDSIIKTMGETESISIHYRVIYREELHYYCQKIVRVGSSESFDHIVFGTICEDETVEARRKELELKQSLDFVARSLKTGLSTKESFLFRGEQLLNSYPDTSYDLCVLRLENFSLLKHQYGSISANKLISLIGQLLQAYLTEMNCIAYAGDGTFVSLTVNTPDRVRKDNIMKFRQDILDQSELKNLDLKWSIYKNMERELPVSEIYEKTVYALSTIRSSIHEDYVEFDQAVFEQMAREEAIEKNFDTALANGEFIVFYQPKFSAKTRGIIGAEALVRWIKSDGTIVAPDKFIPILERCGKINRLDAEVFTQVCRMQKRLEALGLPPLPISVNLSRASIFTGDIAQTYSGIAESLGVMPSVIPIEITESAAVRAAAIHSFADDLISRGFVLHMDDFGSGYSSLVSLSVIPFETIKLDKSLIGFIGRQDSENILKHVIAFSHEQGMTVVAEGVETYEQFMFLKIIGCDAIQGFYFSRALSEEDFIRQVSMQQ